MPRNQPEGWAQEGVSGQPLLFFRFFFFSRIRAEGLPVTEHKLQTSTANPISLFRVLELAHLRSSSVGHREEGYLGKDRLFPETLWHPAALSPFQIWEHIQSKAP